MPGYLRERISSHQRGAEEPTHVQRSTNPFLQAELDYRRDRIARPAPRARRDRGTARLDRGTPPTRPRDTDRLNRLKPMSSIRWPRTRSWATWPRHTSRTLVGRDAELTEIASLLGIRRVRGPGRARRAGTGRPARRRRRRRQDPAAHRAARPRPRPRAGRSFAGHCLDFGDSALPYLPVLRDPRPDGRRPARRRRRRRRPPPRPRPAPARPPDARAPTRATSRRALDRADLFEAVHALLEAAAEQRARCCWSSRTSTGPTSRPATCSASCSPARSPARSRSSRRTAPTTCTAATRCARQVAEWSRLRGVDRIQLEPLSRRRRPRRSSPSSAPARRRRSTADEVADIVDRAEGNAFFVEELVGAASGPGPLGPRRPRRRAAGAPRPARRHRPPGRPRRQRRRAPGLPRAARRRRPGSTPPPSTRACARPSR